MAYEIKDRIFAYRRFFIPNIITACIIILANSLLIRALRIRDKVRNISFKFVYILSIANVFTGITVILENAVMQSVASPDHFIISWSIVAVLRVAEGLFAQLMIMLLALGRYLQMTRMQSYDRIMTHRNANIFVMLSGLITVCLTGFLGVSYYYGFYKEGLQALYGFAVLSSTLVSALYYRAVRSVTIRIQNDFSPRNIRMHKASREISVATLFVLTSLLFTSTTLLIFSVMTLHLYSQKWTLDALYGSYLMYNVNSALTAIIIIYVNRDLRDYVIQLLTCRRQSP